MLCKLGLNAGTANINTHNATPENSVQALMCANGSVTGGADWYASYKSRDLLAGASNYNSWIINGDLETYVYKTKEEMLSDGKLVKGDMILMLPGSGSPSNRDTHIGFFWGDTPSEDKMWHSLLTSYADSNGNRGNMITEITPASSPSIFIVIKVDNTTTAAVPTETPAPTATPAPTPVTTVIGKVTADVGLNLRRGAGTSYGVILTIPYNKTVTVLDRSNSAWYKVQYGSSTGYVASQYLSVSTVTTTPDAAPAPTPSTTVTGRITADVGLNLRRGAGTNYGVILTIPYNKTVTVLDRSNSGWYKVQYAGQTGYVAAEYLRI